MGNRQVKPMQTLNEEVSQNVSSKTSQLQCYTSKEPTFKDCFMVRDMWTHTTTKESARTSSYRCIGTSLVFFSRFFKNLALVNPDSKLLSNEDIMGFFLHDLLSILLMGATSVFKIEELRREYKIVELSEYGFIGEALMTTLDKSICEMRSAGLGEIGKSSKACVSAEIALARAWNRIYSRFVRYLSGRNPGELQSELTFDDEIQTLYAPWHSEVRAVLRGGCVSDKGHYDSSSGRVFIPGTESKNSLAYYVCGAFLTGDNCWEDEDDAVLLLDYTYKVLSTDPRFSPLFIKRVDLPLFYELRRFRDSTGSVNELPPDFCKSKEVHIARDSDGQLIVNDLHDIEWAFADPRVPGIGDRNRARIEAAVDAFLCFVVSTPMITWTEMSDPYHLYDSNFSVRYLTAFTTDKKRIQRQFVFRGENYTLSLSQIPKKSGRHRYYLTFALGRNTSTPGDRLRLAYFTSYSSLYVGHDVDVAYNIYSTYTGPVV
ncbi:hypothetical protein B484DRAFT_465686 [Ochromonadaceae sp. CCMP2298]|nr:hypothetical protein B484DRAFT_465686 [Ochromonadaceae sp. CCMP2298]